MLTAVHLLMLLPLVAVLSWLATKIAIPQLRASNTMDLPDERRLHRVPTPRGGGVAMMGVLLPAWLVMAAISGTIPQMEKVLAGLLLLVLVSWLEDKHGVAPLWRLVWQALAVGLGLTLVPDSMLIFQGLAPLWLDRLAAGLLWVWFINACNFMDGIDGMATTNHLFHALAITIAGSMIGMTLLDPIYLLLLAAVVAGFLPWNWQPARIFMGDIGSVPLGYAIGVGLIALAASGAWAAALIIPAYYLMDATITLLRRILTGEKFWHPHRTHYYQLAAHRLGRHDIVVLWTVLGNLALLGVVALTLLVDGRLALAGAVVALALCWRFYRFGQGR